MSSAIRPTYLLVLFIWLVAGAATFAGCSDDEGSASEVGDSPSGGDGDDDDDVRKPAKPVGLGEEQTVVTPEVSEPLPSIVGAAANGDGTLRRILNENAVAYLLRGINEIWQGTTDEYQNASSGDGPDTFVDDPIIDDAVWRANIQYVIDATALRTEDQAILAFLDDTRSKNYSVIDGYGPLTEAYVANSGAYTDIPAPSTAQILEDTHYQPLWNDNIIFAGDQQSTLGKVVTLVDAFRQRSPASTSGSKYLFSTPRPWRMNDDGEVDFLGTAAYECVDVDGNISNPLIDDYTTSVKIVPGLMCARRAHSQGDHENGLYSEDTENRRKDGAYPSGHTNAGYLAALAYAYALPQRYAEMLTRASELGESRILAGMHSPVDVIGGRIHATIVASYALNQEDIAAEAKAAFDQAQDHFGDLAEAEGMSLYEYAHRTVEDEGGLVDDDSIRIEVYDNNLYDDLDADKETYRFRMTYGLPRDPSKAGEEPIVPEGAEALLASRQPYLTDTQRRAVLYTTSIDSGYPVLDQSQGWGRLDLVTAADGYGAFLGDVSVTMDADQGGFSVQDAWRNDISGPGRLTKAGNGQLTLTGENSYSGGTVLQGGTLEAQSTTAFGTGDLYVEDGTAVVDVEGPLALAGNLTMDGGTLKLVMDDDASQVTVDDMVYLDGGSLALDFSEGMPESGAELTLITGALVYGTFERVDAGDANVDLEYQKDAVIVRVP